MIGSWAGAMGQTQFLPSVFLGYAIDADGDGRRDIWASMADVMASTANFLARSGWQADHPWGVEVRCRRASMSVVPTSRCGKPAHCGRQRAFRLSMARHCRRSPRPLCYFPQAQVMDAGRPPRARNT